MCREDTHSVRVFVQFGTVVAGSQAERRKGKIYDPPGDGGGGAE